MNKKSNKPYHIVHYVEQCSPRMKKFNSIEKLNDFVKKFQKKHPPTYLGDYWIDFTITGITGNIDLIEPGFQEVES